LRESKESLEPLVFGSKQRKSSSSFPKARPGIQGEELIGIKNTLRIFIFSSLFQPRNFHFSAKKPKISLISPAKTYTGLKGFKYFLCQ